MSFFTAAVWQKGREKETNSLPLCGQCGLFRQCHSPKMEPSGEGKRSILVVGEAPGEKEDENGEHFVGKTGQHLRSVLSSLGVELDDCTKTNAIICHPPKNKTTTLHIDSCRPNITKTVRETKANVIILLGGSAVRSLIPTEREDAVGSIKKWVGWKIPSKEHNAWICPTYHPSYVVREEDPALDLIWKEHLRQAIELEETPVEGETLDELKKQVEIIPNFRQGRLRLKDLLKESGVCAFDYEATGRKPDHPKQRIVAVSFCVRGEYTFSTRVNSDTLPMLSRVLRRKQLKKVAANMKNEERWTVAKMGHRVRGWYFDPMLGAHYLDNRTGITGLKFQSFVQFGVPDYNKVVEQYFEEIEGTEFNRIDECPVDDLLLYNGMDSLLTYRLMIRQRKQIGMSVP